MELLCARLSCRHEAAASLQFNTDQAEVIIIDLTDPTGGIPLCQDHVKTRTAPMGWTMVDQRLGIPARRHLESVPQPERSMSMSAPTTTDLDLTANHPAGGSVSDRVSADIVTPAVVGPEARPSQRRPVERGFPWEWAGAETTSSDEAEAEAADSVLTDSDQAGTASSDESRPEGESATDDEQIELAVVETDDEDKTDGVGPSGVDTSAKPSTPLLSRAFRNNPMDPDEAS